MDKLNPKRRFDRSIIVDDLEDDPKKESDNRKVLRRWFNDMEFKPQQMGKILFVSRPGKPNG